MSNATKTNRTSQQIIALARKEWDVDSAASGEVHTIADAVKEWANCREAIVAEDGEVYIADPQQGHWLDDDKLAEFVEWMRGQDMI